MAYEMPGLPMPKIKAPVMTDEKVAAHRLTCPVCSTLGVKRTDHEVTVSEFTPGGNLYELVIRQGVEPLQDLDIAWILQHATSLLTPGS